MDAKDSKPNPDPSLLTTEQLLRELSSLKATIDAGMDGLRAFTDERFRGISVQISERDATVQKDAQNVKAAVDAAFAAQKEAVSEQNKSNALSILKSETGFEKRIDGIGILISAMQKGLDDKIDDLKTRLTAMESHGKGMGDSGGIVIAVVGILIGIGGLVVAFMMRAAPHV